VGKYKRLTFLTFFKKYMTIYSKMYVKNSHQ